MMDNLFIEKINMVEPSPKRNKLSTSDFYEQQPSNDEINIYNSNNNSSSNRNSNENIDFRQSPNINNNIDNNNTSKDNQRENHMENNTSSNNNNNNNNSEVGKIDHSGYNNCDGSKRNSAENICNINNPNNMNNINNNSNNSNINNINRSNSGEYNKKRKISHEESKMNNNINNIGSSNNYNNNNNSNNSNSHITTTTTTTTTSIKNNNDINNSNYNSVINNSNINNHNNNNSNNNNVNNQQPQSQPQPQHQQQQQQQSQHQQHNNIQGLNYGGSNQNQNQDAPIVVNSLILRSIGMMTQKISKDFEELTTFMKSSCPMLLRFSGVENSYYILEKLNNIISQSLEGLPKTPQSSQTPFSMVPLSNTTTLNTSNYNFHNNNNYQQPSQQQQYCQQPSQQHQTYSQNNYNSNNNTYSNNSNQNSYNPSNNSINNTSTGIIPHHYHQQYYQQQYQQNIQKQQHHQQNQQHHQQFQQPQQQQQYHQQTQDSYNLPSTTSSSNSPIQHHLSQTPAPFYQQKHTTSNTNPNNLARISAQFIIQNISNHQIQSAHIEFSSSKLQDFKLLDLLGSGSFAKVRLCQHISSGRLFCMKILNQNKIIRLRQEIHVCNEKEVLLQVDNPFIVKLFKTFKDDRYLYFLQEFIPGGELFDYIRASGSLSLYVTQIYAAEIVLALEYLHNMDIIYRDLKPENLLIDQYGHIKLTDFGFAKKIKENTKSMCGTPEYIAPEILSGHGHGKSADWWSLGILIYEMLVGVPPFVSEGSQNDIFRLIREAKIQVPSEVDHAARDLIEKLVVADVEKRLGSLEGGVEDIKNHPFFNGVDWNRVQNREHPPLKPRIRPLKHHILDERLDDEEDRIGVNFIKPEILERRKNEFFSSF